MGSIYGAKVLCTCLPPESQYVRTRFDLEISNRNNAKQISDIGGEKMRKNGLVTLITLAALVSLLITLTSCIMPTYKRTFCDTKESGFDWVVSNHRRLFFEKRKEPKITFTKEEELYRKKSIQGIVIRRVNSENEPDSFAGFHPDCDSDNNGQPDIFLAATSVEYRRVRRVTRTIKPYNTYNLNIDGIPLEDALFLYNSQMGRINLDKLKEIVERGVDINLPRVSGKSLLIMAAEKGNREAVDFLLAHGADSKYKTKEDYSFFMALVVGALDGHIKRLISEGVDANQKMNSTNETPLIFAVETGNKKITRMLISTGADVTLSKKRYIVIDHENNYEHQIEPMMSRIHSRAIGVLDYGRYNKGADAPLMMAARDGDIEMMKIILDACEQRAKKTEDVAGKCVDTANDLGESALFLAARFGQDEAAFWLINKGANTRKKMLTEQTLLDNAAIGGSEKLTRRLLNEGVRMSGPPKRTSALQHAIRYGHANVVAMLLDRNMWDDTTRANLTDEDLVSEAYASSQPAILRLLPRKALRPFAEPIFWGGIRESNAEMVTLGLDLGANVNKADYWGNTPLIITSQEGNIELTRVILLNKPDIAHRNNQDETALSLARALRYDDIVALIEETMPPQKE